jgi:D-arabinose 1-dehydrogenase-like Zn-dependent alcohol dehydrogenase
MKAAVLAEYNKPFRIKDIQEKEPGIGQVRIRIRASGFCGTDVHVWRGNFPINLPAVLGHEPVGTIDKLGAGVTHLKEGERVGVSWLQGSCGRCSMCQGHREQYCENGVTWIQNGGGNAELMIAEASGCTLLPDDISWAEAAPIFCAGFTVFSGYRNAQPRPGERIGVIGIGGLGHLAIQYAKAMGHEVVAITGSADKRDLVKKLGADEVLVVKDNPGRELREMGGVDIVLSTSNSMKQNSQVIEGLRPEGRLISMAAGGEEISIKPRNLFKGQLTIKGSTQNKREDLVHALDLVAKGKVKPILELYKLDEINRVLERLLEGKIRFRAVFEYN